MLTLRIHLDEMTMENGPLRVMPGTHHAGKATNDLGCGMKTILARRGDVLAMRPLLSHGSSDPIPGTNRHRRVLHLEFAPGGKLPDGYQWHDFLSSVGHPSRG
jgi:hypothetical protein